VLSKGKATERHYGTPVSNVFRCVSYLTVGLQLAEVSSIPRQVVNDAKRIAELVQQQMQVRKFLWLKDFYITFSCISEESSTT